VEAHIAIISECCIESREKQLIQHKISWLFCIILPMKREQACIPVNIFNIFAANLSGMKHFAISQHLKCDAQEYEARGGQPLWLMARSAGGIEGVGKVMCMGSN